MYDYVLIVINPTSNNKTMVIYDPKYSVCEQNDILLSGALLLEKDAELAQ